MPKARQAFPMQFSFWKGNEMNLRLTSSALALAAMTAPAFADVTSEQVWQSWVDYYNSAGYQVTEGKREKAGDTLTITAFAFAKRFYKILLPIVVLYSLLYFVIVRVNIKFDQQNTVDAAKKIFDINGASLLTRVSSLAGVVSSYRPSGSEQVNTLSSVLVIVFSLIYIWAIRALSMGKKYALVMQSTTELQI
jgi:hypothetical protein